MKTQTKAMLLRVLGAALLLLGVVGRPQSADARLDPFYIVHGATYGTVSPRILFMLDTSASMGMDITYDPNATYPSTKCWWDNCEDGSKGALQSRIHAARKVIADLAHANQDKAEFGLMTYATALPPNGTPGRPVPDPCTATASTDNLVKNKDYRFTWVENVNQPYSTQWKPAHNIFGEQGMWVLCGDNRPFPYLRHDELGGFSMPNNSADPLLDQPLYKTYSDIDAYEDPANYSRRVQWFPRWVGRRVNLDCADSFDNQIAEATYGDFDGNNIITKKNNVCGHDFYYWPYVDGNPGYSYYQGKSVDPMQHLECDQNGANCKKVTDDVHRLGIARREPGSKASLYAPFYSKAAVDDPNVAATDKGPRDLDDAWLMFDGITDEMYAGGADVLGGTPISTSLGVVENLVNIDNKTNTITSAKPSLPWTNAVFSHETVASYLSFLRLVEDDGMCRPVTLIIVSDGVPDPWNNEGGAVLYERLRSVRRLLGVKTYMVAFTEEVYADPVNLERINEIACSASGADSIPTPCAGGNTFSNWDTCADPNDPANNCAWLTQDQNDLQVALTQIIAKALALDVPSGTPTQANDFQLSDPNNPESSQAAIQTSITSYTEAPAWIGHVQRGACTDEDPNNPGQLADYCANAASVPIDTPELESFGPCPISRVWDAGECLQLTDWNNRRIYTHDYNNNVFRISEANGDPSPEFAALINQLNSDGKLDPPLSNDPTEKADQIVAMTQWLLGKDMPNGWKLPGLPNSAAILIRRVPQYNSQFLPTVGIRDPHCAGRRNLLGDNVPESLEQFATDAWTVDAGNGFADHYNYTEAVLVGDDFGILHAFHYDSGNELFGFVPLVLINNARALSAGGTTESFGQTDSLSDHVFGVASTINNGWAYDDQAQQWRHLAVFGLGPGGSEIITLDVSHMGRLQTDDPIELVWTTSTTSIAQDYAETLGETWARPALTYAARNDSMSLEPKAYLVFGSGYRDNSGPEERGRTVWVVDAITGETVTQRAYMAPPLAGSIYDTSDDYAAVSDIAVGSHCLSRYWGEMEEAYWADPAGRLYRWDLVTDTSDTTQFLHTSDGGGSVWPTNGQQFAVAQESFRFPACQGKGDYACTVGQIGLNGIKGDVFTFSPAVVAANRIDPPNGNGGVLPIGDRDQFLVALASGSAIDNSLDGGDSDNDFHSSLYLLVDDHREGAAHEGFTIPGNGGITLPGDEPKFMRLPLSSIERTRTIVFPNGDTQDETRKFTKAARPLRAPSVRVTGLADGTQLIGEVFYITYTVYEPGSSLCDSRWFDTNTGEWVADPGSTYEISFRLVVKDGDTFNFGNGYTLASNYGDGFGTSGGLSGPVVNQQVCEGENCGAILKAPSTKPCDPNQNPPTIGGAISVQTGWSELEGFSPLEVQL